MKNLSPGIEYLSPGIEYFNPGIQYFIPGAKNLSPGIEPLRPGIESLSPGIEPLTLELSHPSSVSMFYWDIIQMQIPGTFRHTLHRPYLPSKPWNAEKIRCANQNFFLLCHSCSAGGTRAWWGKDIGYLSLNTQGCACDKQRFML